MGVEIQDLAHGEKHEADVDERGVCRDGSGGGAGHVDEKRHDQARESPVVPAVLEDVEGRHGGGGEAVDVEGFEFTFGEVEECHYQCQGLTEAGEIVGRDDALAGRVVEEGREDGEGRVSGWML